MKDINERLRDAARDGSETVLKSLLRNPGCDALSKDEQGWTALMHAARGGHEAGLRILLPVSDALGKDVNGQTALMQSAARGHEAGLRILLPVSDALAKDNGGWTALMYAAGNGNEACVRLLMLGSDACAKDRNGMTASKLAKDEGYESLGCFIDAYVMAQNERVAIKAAVLSKSPCGRSSLRV